MKLDRLIFFLLLIFLTNCKSSTEQIKDAFKKVDKSLENSNNILSNSIEGLYAAIDTNRKQHEQLALKADSIYFAAAKAKVLIESLKQAMQNEDTSGTRLNIATKLLASGNVEHDLTQALLHVYVTANSYHIDNTKKQNLDSVLLSIKEIQGDRDWTKKYFENTATVAAITMFSKFQNDCTNAAVIVLDDIKQRLVK
jgi:hypothetical protein